MILTVSADVFACHSAACRPPTSGGTGGSISKGGRGNAGIPRQDQIDAQRRASGKLSQVQAADRAEMKRKAVSLTSVTQAAAKALKEPDGGFTIQASTGRTIRSGFAVALKGSDKLISAKALFDSEGRPSQEFQALVQDRVAALQSALPSLPKGVQHALGGWHNPDDGKVEVNISVVFPPTQQAAAMKFAKANDQISMARLHDPFEIISTGGTGGDRTS